MPRFFLADGLGKLASRVGGRWTAGAQDRLLLDFSADAVMGMGFDGWRRYVSPSFSRMTGWSRDEALSRNDRVLVHPDDQDNVAHIATKLLAGEPEAGCTYRYVRKDGSHVWVEGRFRLASRRHRLGLAYAGGIRDITDRKCLEVKLAVARANLAGFSAMGFLVPLASRQHLDDVLAAEWARGVRGEQPLSLLLLEADYCAAYRSTYGQNAGEVMLRVIAACVHGGPCRTTDVTALYDDEAFAVLMPQTDGFGAMMMGEHIRNAVLDRNLPHLGSPHGVVSVSIGVATAVPCQGRDAAALVGKAEAALGEARRHGRNRIEADEAVVAAAAVAGGWFDARDHTVRKPR